MLRLESAFSENSPENFTNDTVEELFDFLREGLSREVPGGFDWQWRPSNFYVTEAFALERGDALGGYTSEGRDTVETKGAYNETLVTGSGFDTYCRAFGYGVYGRDLQGKKILDVGSGESLFGAIANYAYGERGTSVFSLDPLYGDSEKVHNLVNKAQNLLPLGYESVSESRKPHFISGLVQEIPFEDSSFNEVISHFGATLVPKEQFPTVVREMLRVAKDKVQIVPLILFENVEYFDLPRGVELKRLSLDGFTFIINKESSDIEEVIDWIKENGYGEGRKMQFHSSPDLSQLRKNGYYQKEELRKYREAAPIEIDSTGNIVG